MIAEYPEPSHLLRTSDGAESMVGFTMESHGELHETQRKGQLYVAITTFVSLDKVFQVERHVAHLKIAAVCAAAVVTSITRGTDTRRYRCTGTTARVTCKPDAPICRGH